MSASYCCHHLKLLLFQRGSSYCCSKLLLLLVSCRFIERNRDCVISLAATLHMSMNTKPLPFLRCFSSKCKTRVRGAHQVSNMNFGCFSWFKFKIHPPYFVNNLPERFLLQVFYLPFVVPQNVQSCDERNKRPPPTNELMIILNLQVCNLVGWPPTRVQNWKSFGKSKSW